MPIMIGVVRIKQGLDTTTGKHREGACEDRRSDLDVAIETKECQSLPANHYELGVRHRADSPDLTAFRKHSHLTP